MRWIHEPTHGGVGNGLGVYLFFGLPHEGHEEMLEMEKRGVEHMIAALVENGFRVILDDEGDLHSVGEESDAEVLGDYVRSACPATAENLARIQRLQDAVTEEIERLGSFHLTVAAGVCHARAPRTQAAAGS